MLFSLAANSPTHNSVPLTKKKGQTKAALTNRSKTVAQLSSCGSASRFIRTRDQFAFCVSSCCTPVPSSTILAEVFFLCVLLEERWCRSCHSVIMFLCSFFFNMLFGFPILSPSSLSSRSRGVFSFPPTQPYALSQTDRKDKV